MLETRGLVKTMTKEIRELIKDRAVIPDPWDGYAVMNDDNMTYIVWNAGTKEALVIDPMREDWETLLGLIQKLKDLRFLAVIDTHTHADHVSCAADVAAHLKVPLVQHRDSPSQRVHLRICQDTQIPTSAGPLICLLTPGHTPDGVTFIWGPFLFGGDTLLYGDTGRDDLPGGNAAEHWRSLQKIKVNAAPDCILLPGHDGQGGRASSWKTQMEVNPGLNQDEATFINDAGAYVGPSPRLLKESLFYNFK